MTNIKVSFLSKLVENLLIYLEIEKNTIIVVKEDSCFFFLSGTKLDCFPYSILKFITKHESLRLPPEVYFRDYAGGCSVHAVGGVAALVGCIFIGPRLVEGENMILEFSLILIYHLL